VKRSLRYYEQQELLTSERTPSGQTHLFGCCRGQGDHIQELFAAGRHSTQIATLLPCMDDDDGGSAADATPRLVTELTAERNRALKSALAARALATFVRGALSQA
jgi:hypothetical protein